MIPSTLERFLVQASSQYDENSPESFWCCEDAFRELLRAPLIAELFNDQLECLLAQADYFGNWGHQQLNVAESGELIFSVSMLQEPTRYVHTAPFLALYSPVGRAALNYVRYPLPPAYRNELFDPELRLAPGEAMVCEPGQVLRIDARGYAYDLQPCAGLALVRLATRPFQTLTWLFDKQTLKARQANDAELGATRLRLTAQLLGRLAQPSSLEPLSQLTRHPHHAVRWAAIQGLGRIDATVALRHLEAALQDPHPHVRQAAATTLERTRASAPLPPGRS